MKHLSTYLLLLISLFLGATTLLGEELGVIISPENTNPSITFHSNTAGELHSLTILPASGYRFRDPPILELNPAELWTRTASSSFSLLDMDGRKHHSAKIIGSITPVGGGSGGGGRDITIPFDISLITKYFTTTFLLPTPFTHTLTQNSEIDVSVVLSTATGQPASGILTFSSTLGTFSGTSIPLTAGSAFDRLTISGTVGLQSTISAHASQIPIAFDQFASGTKLSHQLEIIPSSTSNPPGIPLISPGKPTLTELDNSTKVLIEWEDRSDNESSFYVERSLNGSDWQRLAALPPDSTSFTDSPVDPFSPYLYRIVAHNENP